MDEFEKELKLGFLDEASQSISDVEQCFLELESDPSNTENLNKIFRLAHNLKGSSKAVGFEEMGHFTHGFESFILKIKNGELNLSNDAVNLLLEANDHLREMIDIYRIDLSASVDSSRISDRIEKFSAVSSVETVSPEALESESTDSEQSLTMAEQNFGNASPAKTKHAKTQTDESLRVALSKVEKLIDYIGEMVILQNVLREQTQDIPNALVRKSFGQLGKVGKEIQDLAMSLRMVPIKNTFQKMQRIVRDTATSLNKDVKLNLIGEETELDKTVLEMINDPLVHLIRNSIDHGIEQNHLRAAAGKAETGEVTLSAFHSAGRLILEIADDGAGLNPEKLQQKALEKGLIEPNVVLSEKESYQLIFAPGFSTKDIVTDISGRGVGMDVVKTNIHELGGEIQVESTLGKGTTFRISLPLTLAIVDAMIIKYEAQRFVLPLSHIHETLQPKAEMIQTTAALGDILLLRGETLPLFKLGDFFGLRSPIKALDMTAIVVRSGEKPFAFLVDDIIGQQQVVVKQLSRDLSAFRGSSGTTILGDGKPALIIEPGDLIKRTILRKTIPSGAA